MSPFAGDFVTVVMKHVKLHKNVLARLGDAGDDAIERGLSVNQELNAIVAS
jgi:hypothetical protein